MRGQSVVAGLVLAAAFGGTSLVDPSPVSCSDDGICLEEGSRCPEIITSYKRVSFHISNVGPVVFDANAPNVLQDGPAPGGTSRAVGIRLRPATEACGYPITTRSGPAGANARFPGPSLRQDPQMSRIGSPLPRCGTRHRRRVHHTRVPASILKRADVRMAKTTVATLGSAAAEAKRVTSARSHFRRHRWVGELSSMCVSPAMSLIGTTKTETISTRPSTDAGRNRFRARMTRSDHCCISNAHSLHACRDLPV